MKHIGVKLLRKVALPAAVVAFDCGTVEYPIATPSRFADYVSESLQQDVHDNADEIRAAAYLVYVLAKNDLWQDGRLAEVTALAISRLRIILDEEVYENVNLHGETIYLVNQLREVEPKPGQNSRHPPWEP